MGSRPVKQYLAIIRTPHRATGQQQIFIRGPFESAKSALACGEAHISEGNGYGGCGDCSVVVALTHDIIHEAGECLDGSRCGFMMVLHGK